MLTVDYICHIHYAYKAGVHLDFRIKYPNKRKLASWAIPKTKFPERDNEKVLAIKTNDHGMNWLHIDKLTIPRGDYGGGYIKTIQKGKATIYNWTDSFIKFELTGPKINGLYMLVKFKSEEKNDTWFLMKSKEF